MCSILEDSCIWIFVVNLALLKVICYNGDFCRIQFMNCFFHYQILQNSLPMLKSLPSNFVTCKIHYKILVVKKVDPYIDVGEVGHNYKHGCKILWYQNKYVLRITIETENIFKLCLKELQNNDNWDIYVIFFKIRTLYF